MRRYSQFLVTAVCLIAITLIAVGCATIMKGTKHKVSINSTPSQAKINIKTLAGMVVFEGKTPASTEISKKNEYIVTISVEGYKDKTINITKDGVEGWFWGNILCGGIIGIIVDLTNGAINKLEPDQINVELVTAQLDSQNDVLYTVFYALDSEGQLRSLAVPLQKIIQQ